MTVENYGKDVSTMTDSELSRVNLSSPALNQAQAHE